MTMTIDHARQVIARLASGDESQPPVLQKEINQAFAVCLQAVMREPTDLELSDAFTRALRTANPRRHTLHQVLDRNGESSS